MGVMYAEMPPVAHEPARLAAEVQRVFWQRVFATVIDLLVVSLVNFFISGVFGVTQVTSGSPLQPPGSPMTQFTTATGVGWVWLTLVWLVYCFGLEALFGATVGKWVLRLRVTDREGRRPLLRQIAVRNVVRVIDALPVGYLIGGSVALLSPWRQRLGDHLADTVVLPQEAVTEAPLTPAARRQRLTLVGVILLAFLAFCSAFFYYVRSPLVVQGMVNTRQMMFRGGVSAYTLSAPVWRSGTVTYQIQYLTERPVDTCHGRLTLVWALPTGWEPSYGEASCAKHSP